MENYEIEAKAKEIMHMAGWGEWADVPTEMIELVAAGDMDQAEAFAETAFEEYTRQHEEERAAEDAKFPCIYED